MARLQSVEIIDDGRHLATAWDDGETLRYHAVWLKDNALDPLTRSPDNGQRLLALGDLDENARIAAAGVSPAGLSVSFVGDEEQRLYPAAWLRRNAYDRQPGADRRPGWIRPGIRLWDGISGHPPPEARFEAVRDRPEALHRWLAAVAERGFAKLVAGPARSGALLEVAELFGYVRETNYGKWFEVRAEINPTNLAYTALALPPHTDNPYRDPVPTLQILYCLENSAEGGESQVVDGFAAIHRLRAEDPEGFDLLSRYCARFEYRGAAGVRLSARRPIIELAPDGELTGLRFNHRSAAPLADVPFAAMTDYYRAYRRLAAIIEDPALAVSFKLEPGECFIVDNTRVLHARKAYSGSGSRWLQGCYADRDGLYSRLAALAEADNGSRHDGQP